MITCHVPSENATVYSCKEEREKENNVLDYEKCSDLRDSLGTPRDAWNTL